MHKLFVNSSVTLLFLSIAYCKFFLQCMHGPSCRLGNFCTVGRRRQEVNVLGGLILPVWGTIEKALSKQVAKGFLMIF
jgi:hypothetical protein